MKKVLSFVLVLAMVLGSFAPAFATPADDAVANLNEMGIVQGYADGTFGLENNITRAEFAAIVVRMLGLEDLAKNSVYTSQFSDVSEGWFVGYVNVAAGKGIINGFEDGTFRPQEQVTYAQAATMIVRYLEEKVDGGVWPANYLAKANELGVLKDAQAVGSVMDATTRGTVFTMANNALKAGEANKPVVSKVKALVVENSRVESLDADEVIVEVMDDYTRKDMENGTEDPNFNGLEAGTQFSYTVKKNEDPEMLLGKVVYLGFTGDKVTSVEVSDEYKYLSGDLDEIDKNSLEVDGDKYTVEKEDRFGTEKDYTGDRRFYQAYVNGDDVSYSKFDDKDEYDFARVTVKNGKVLFIDAYNFEDIAPIEDVDGKMNMSVYEDERDARTKKYDLDDYDKEDLIKVVVKDEMVELYRMDVKDIAADQVVHFTDENDQLLIREEAKFEGEYDKAKTKKIDGDRETVLYYGDNKHEARIDDDNLDAVYSYDGKDYKELTKDFDDELEDFKGRDVEVLIDMFNKVQLVRSDFQDPRFFAIVTRALADKFDAIGKDNEETKYEADTKTDLYEVELQKLIDDKKTDDIYDIDDDYEVDEDNDKNEDLDDLLGKNELVFVEVDDKDVDSLIKIDLGDFDKIDKDNTSDNDTAFFYTETFKDSFVRNADGDDYEIDGNTKVFFIGEDGDDDDVKAYDSAKDFLDKYEVTSKDNQGAVVAVVPAEDDADLAEVVVIAKATEEGDDTDEMVVKVTNIDASGKHKSLEFEDVDGKEYEYELEKDSDAYDLVDDGKIETDDIVEITYYEEGDNEITKIKELITENQKANYMVYKVLDVEKSGEYVLGYMTEDQKDAAMDKIDDDEDDFEDIDFDEFDDLSDKYFTEARIRVNSDADTFGKDVQDGYIMVHVDKYDRVDVVNEIDDEEDILELLAEKAPEGADVVDPDPDEDEFTAEVKLRANGTIAAIKYVDVVETNVKDAEDFQIGEKKEAIAGDDEMTVGADEYVLYILNADGDKIAKGDIDTTDVDKDGKTVEIDLELIK